MICGGPATRRPVMDLMSKSKNLKTMASKRRKATVRIKRDQVWLKLAIRDIHTYVLIPSFSPIKGSKKQKVEITSGARDIRGFLSSPIAGSSNATVTSGTPSSPLKRTRPAFKSPVKGPGTSGTDGIKSVAKGKSISGYFNSSNPSAKGKTVAGFVGATKNKGSSTITVKSPSMASTETSPPSNKARPTQGGVVSRPVTSFTPFSGQGRLLGGGVGGSSTKTPWSTTSLATGSKIQSLTPTRSPIKKESAAKIVEIVSLDDSRDEKPTVKEELVPCPVCQTLMAISQVNSHLDSCLL